MSARRSLVLLLAAAAEDVARVASNAHYTQEVVGSPAIAVVVAPVGTLALVASTGSGSRAVQTRSGRPRRHRRGIDPDVRILPVPADEVTQPIPEQAATAPQDAPHPQNAPVPLGAPTPAGATAPWWTTRRALAPAAALALAGGGAAIGAAAAGHGDPVHHVGQQQRGLVANNDGIGRDDGDGDGDRFGDGRGRR